jgi:hypothetical protein
MAVRRSVTVNRVSLEFEHPYLTAHRDFKAVAHWLGFVRRGLSVQASACATDGRITIDRPRARPFSRCY